MKANKKLNANIKKDSVNNFVLDFLLRGNLFLKRYLSDFLFKLGMFKSAMHQKNSE